MAKQFAEVNGRYGAPMGRSESPLGEAPRAVRLFRVPIDGGGYDPGGAYWGLGSPLWCALCDEGGRQFARARSRREAADKMGIPAENLKRGF